MIRCCHDRNMSTCGVTSAPQTACCTPGSQPVTTRRAANTACKQGLVQGAAAALSPHLAKAAEQAEQANGHDCGRRGYRELVEQAPHRRPQFRSLRSMVSKSIQLSKSMEGPACLALMPLMRCAAFCSRHASSEGLAHVLNMGNVQPQLSRKAHPLRSHQGDMYTTAAGAARRACCTCLRPACTVRRVVVASARQVSPCSVPNRFA